MTDNVIQFNAKKKDKELTKQQEITYIIEDLIDDVMGEMFFFLDNEGFDISQESCVKTVFLLEESLRASMYKVTGLEHPLSEAIDSVLIIETENEINNVEVLNNVDSGPESGYDLQSDATDR